MQHKKEQNVKYEKYGKKLHINKSIYLIVLTFPQGFAGTILPFLSAVSLPLTLAQPSISRGEQKASLKGLFVIIVISFVLLLCYHCHLFLLFYFIFYHGDIICSIFFVKLNILMLDVVNM